MKKNQGCLKKDVFLLLLEIRQAKGYRFLIFFYIFRIKTADKKKAFKACCYAEGLFYFDC